MQRQWRLFAEKPPKGFEKFFKPGAGKDAPKSEAAKDAKPADTKPSSSGSSTRPPPSTSSNQNNPWSLGAFGPNAKSGPGGGGKSFEGGDREKWIIGAIVGALGLFGAMSMMEVGNKEITWREFVYR